MKTGLAIGNAYGGYTEANAGFLSLAAPEPTGITKAAGIYGIADGATRVLSTPLILYGIWTENKTFENAPSNILGLFGNIYDNVLSSNSSFTTGGNGQLVGELTGDFGLSRRNLINTLEKEATTNSQKYIKMFKVLKETTFVPISGAQKAKKINETNQ